MSYGTPPPPTSAQPGYGGYIPRPNHPQAVTVLVLGILGLVACGVLGIPAWVMGNRVLREIDASHGAVDGRGMVQAGRICGIVATVMLAFGVLMLVGFLGLFVVGGIATSGT
jgi:hypothetical protein